MGEGSVWRLWLATPRTLRQQTGRYFFLNGLGLLAALGPALWGGSSLDVRLWLGLAFWSAGLGLLDRCLPSRFLPGIHALGTLLFLSRYLADPRAFPNQVLPPEMAPLVGIWLLLPSLLALAVGYGPLGGLVALGLEGPVLRVVHGLSGVDLLIALLPMVVVGILGSTIFFLYHNLDGVQKRLERTAFLDPLTGLGNRRALWEALRQRWNAWERYQIPFSILLLDLDGFKEVNDRFGHAEGDRILREVAQILQKTVRESDVLFRYGGDEFVLLVTHLPEKETDRLIHRLQEQVEGRFQEKGLRGFSVGMAAVEERPWRQVEELLETADARMYAHKAHRKERSPLQMVDPSEPFWQRVIA